MEKGSGVGIRSGVEFARKAKLVGGNLSRGAVRIHLNPLPPPSSFLRDSSFESLAEKDLVWPSEKRLKGDREGGGEGRIARGEARKLEASMPARLDLALPADRLNKQNRLKAPMHRRSAISVRSRSPFFRSRVAGRWLLEISDRGGEKGWRK